MPMDNTTGYFRLFVAIVLPEAVRTAVLRVQRELQSLTPRDAIRWSQPEQFHLTLRFLGNVPVAAVGDLERAVAAVCQPAAPLSLSAQAVGFFPNPRSPRVLWVGISDREQQLMNLQRRIETAVRPLSPEPGAKNFTGHITLARLKSPRPADVRDLVGRAESLGAQSFGEWTAREIEIIRSELSPNGARYTSLASCPLGGG